jgi:hypothetical protein
VICGDLGYKNAAGMPCGQNISSVKREACVHHRPADGPSIQSLGGAASWMAHQRRMRLFRKRLDLGSPEKQMELVERAAGALTAAPGDPAVIAWADTLSRLADRAARVWDAVNVDRRLKALEAQK